MTQHVSVGDGGLLPSTAGKHAAKEELMHDSIAAATPLIHPSVTRMTTIIATNAWTFEVNLNVPVLMFFIAALLKP